MFKFHHIVLFIGLLALGFLKVSEGFVVPTLKANCESQDILSSIINSNNAFSHIDLGHEGEDETETDTGFIANTQENSICSRKNCNDDWSKYYSLYSLILFEADTSPPTC
ncbi:MAG: hypothetical protein N4A71_09275 [Carboxylicivirga sp.]|jgi:hypothetical protein|nr:hypothetical protein [Carboxylicivirga sp.]